jgi:colanic acid/amylovoran biosynthesis protein
MQPKRMMRYVRDSKFFSKVVSSSAYRLAVKLVDDATLVLHRDDSLSGEMTSQHLLFAPTGGGNIGDQALFESFLSNVNGPVKVIVTSPLALDVPNQHAARVRFVVDPGLSYLPPPLRAVAIFRLISNIKTARSFSVIGADLMDGLYNPAASLSRAGALRIAARLQVPSVLLGASWAADALPSCGQALAEAADAGAVLYFRDSLSLERARRQGIRGRLSSDIVFAADDRSSYGPSESFVERARHDRRKIAVLNASGLVGKRISQADEYERLIVHLLTTGNSVILLPHVIRQSGDDLAELRPIAARFADDSRVHLISEKLEPSAIRQLCSEADLVITGRMHLAVIALSQGTLAITVGTHGKVEGMYLHFESLDYCVAPSSRLGLDLIDAVIRSSNQDPAWRSSIGAVRALALNNFRTIELVRS